MDVKSFHQLSQQNFSASSRYLITKSFIVLFRILLSHTLQALSLFYIQIYYKLIFPISPIYNFMSCCPSSINCFYVFLMLLRFLFFFFYVVLTFSKFKTHDEIYDNSVACIMYDIVDVCR